MTDLEIPAQRRLSLSAVKLYASCSEKYRLKKVVFPRPPEKPAAWLVHGNAFHEAYDQWEKTDRVANIRDFYEDAWDAEVAKQIEKQPDWDMWVTTPRVKGPQQDLKLRREAGFIQCDNFQTHCENATWKAHKTEFPFELDFDGLTVVGYIDLIKEDADGSYSVCDLKTGSPEDDYRQLGLYALAVRELLGLDVTWGEYWYTKLDAVPKSGDKAGRSSGWIDLARYDRPFWQEYFSATDRGIKSEVFLPNPGAGCMFCEVKPQCREWMNK